jgi:hypothetical protein
MFGKIPDDMVLRDGLKQALFAYMLKPRGKAPKRFTLDDYMNRGKKLVLDSISHHGG